MKTVLSSVCALTLLSLAAGCAAIDENGAAEESVVSAEENLYKAGNRWPQNASTALGAWIPVCYVQGDTTAEEAAAFAATMRNAVENTWGRVADLKFTGWGVCSGSTAGKLVVTINKTGNSQSYLGYQGPSSPTTMALNITDTRQPMVTVHEFGHALSFHHEFTRTDFACALGQRGCRSCTDNSGCKDDNYGNTCVAGFCRHVGGEELVNADTADRESVMASGYTRNRIDGNTNGVANPVVSLSTYDVLGAQQVYGRKPAGSLVGLGGRCANISGGAVFGHGIVASDCLGGANDRFSYNSHYGWLGAIGSMVPTSPSLCMNISGGVTNPNGANPLITWSCGDYSNERFTFDDVQIRTLGNMCLAANSATAGAEIQVQRCGTVSASRERWRVMNKQVSSGEFLLDQTAFQLAGTNLCMTHGAVGFGSRITLQTCNMDFKSYDQSFDVRDGIISVPASPGFCFNVLGGTDAPGQPLGLWNACNSNYVNSYFYLNGMIRSSGQCVDMLGGSSYTGANIGTFPCVESAPNHNWDYYWL
jgi:hypothetical protein